MTTFRSQIRLEGDGLTKGEVDVPSTFRVLNSTGGGGVLSFRFEGPSHVEYTKRKLDDGVIEISYTPKEAGHYEIHVFYQNVHVPGSPSFATVTGESKKKEIPPELQDKIEKIRVYGRGLESGKPLALNKIVIDCSEAGISKKDGLLVSMASPRRRASMISLDDNKDGTYLLTYKPTDPGKYKLNVEVQEVPVPGSPFNINIRGGSIVEYM